MKLSNNASNFLFDIVLKKGLEQSLETFIKSTVLEIVYRGLYGTVIVKLSPINFNKTAVHRVSPSSSVNMAYSGVQFIFFLIL